MSKILAVNSWIKEFNQNTTGIDFNLDKFGVKSVPNSLEEGVEHLYDEWNEPQWNRMLHLSQDTKAKAANQLIEVFTKLDNS